MTNFNFNFYTSDTSIFNDLILEGSPFLIKDYSYNFVIQPNCDYWRFGIRLSKTPKIPFVKMGDRHLSNDLEGFRDIYLSIGSIADGQWNSKNSFALAQYNFPKNILNDHILSLEKGYRDKTKVEFDIRYNSNIKVLDVGYNAEGCSSWLTSIPLEEEYNYFQVFAWADGIAYNLDCLVSIKSQDKIKSSEENILPFQVGNLTFRLGDMFDAFSKKISNVILLPASTNGTATNSILERAAEYDIPPPTSNIPGSLLYFNQQIGKKDLIVGYAYAVDNNTSNESIIEDICENINNHFYNLNNESEDKKINLPLLGTGAGKVSVIDVAVIYDRKFNKLETNSKIIVSIQNENNYRKIKQRMLGKYIALNDERFEKPISVLELERELNIIIDHSAYVTNDSSEVISIGLSYIKSLSFLSLTRFPKLESITLVACQIDDFLDFKGLTNISALTLTSTPFNNYSFLQRMGKLSYLEINDANLSEINFLQNLTNLTTLSLSENNISNLKSIRGLKKLKNLDLSYNLINDLSVLAELEMLESLILCSNRISYIEPLVMLSKLTYLDLGKNNIYDFDPILKLDNLKTLIAYGNPFIERKDLTLNEGDNHLSSIKSLILRQQEEDTEELALPVKILLLGNHASGKSSLLHYILNSDLNISPTSTHIINIKPYPKNTSTIPEAIFFDFGGQDYYHGIYRAFLTAGSIYLMLWNETNNKNQIRKDSNSFLTQDFSLHYWLCQKKYFEKEKFNGDIDPTLLIQTHSDENKRQSFECNGNDHVFENEFFISLAKNSIPGSTDLEILNHYALQYLKESIKLLIKKNQHKSLEPIWYKNFLNFILNSASSSYLPKNIVKDILPEYVRNTDDKLELLKQDLNQLHMRGLILYYQDGVLNESVWLNPVALANYVHSEVLTEKRNSKFNGRIPIENFSDVPEEIINLLELQKVIFKHEYGDNGLPEYIIPNFLPLAHVDSNYELFIFGIGSLLFTLKFKHFLPFGIINQLICHFGDLPETKKFWRDRLVFTFNNSKLLIHINFQTLEIQVSCSFSKNHSDSDMNEIRSYLFYSIMALYWDFKKLLSFSDFKTYFNNGLNIDQILPTDELYNSYYNCKDLYESKDCRPLDLYLSVDDQHFINYSHLCQEDSSSMIISQIINNDRELTDTTRLFDKYSFQSFSKIPFKRKKKIAISYSTRDLKLVHKFRSHLVALSDNDLIDNPFQCTQLIAGEEWNEEIQRKFNEADIIFFLVSDNLMATKYVKEFEIRKAIERRAIDKSFKIIPIILVPCHWTRNDYNLGQFTALPFKASPVTTFPNQDEAWYATIELIRIMIERDLQSDKSSEVILSNELKKIQENYLANR